ncbi:MAG: DUF2764 domain-containing protein, partial [Treponemataceae bacterium]|nr:DUF2764 domain-containing protein [Treponemataceae bacterium]
LMSQLPGFSINQSNPLPVTEEYFLDLCSRFMDKKSVAVLNSLTLEPPKKAKKTDSKLVNEYYDFERKLRFALAELRAQKMKKEFVDEERILSTVPSDIFSIARNAVSFESPLEAENYLNQARVQYLTNISPSDGFCEDAVFAYGLKLKLATRIKMFNEEAGMASYRKIYDTILGEST